MKKMITSVSQGQIDGFATVVADATRKSTREQLVAFNEAGHLNSENMQSLLASGGKIALAVAEAVRMRLQEMLNGIVGCLKLISAGKRVVIGATLGTETLASASDLFSVIDGDFSRWGCDKVEQSTPEMAVEVYEQIENADYRKIFGGFGQNLDRLCLTTPQIKRFVVDHVKDYLLEGEGWTYFRFLFKVGNEFFVALVLARSDGSRKVDVYRFSRDDVWGAGNRGRLVVPQLASVAV